jgi:hypothetical protein
MYAARTQRGLQSGNQKNEVTGDTVSHLIFSLPINRTTNVDRPIAIGALNAQTLRIALFVFVQYKAIYATIYVTEPNE